MCFGNPPKITCTKRHKRYFINIEIIWVNSFQIKSMDLELTVITMVIIFTQLGLDVILFLLLLFSQCWIFNRGILSFILLKYH